MKLVIDTNILISALIKKGITRRIIFSPFIKFITPEHSISEISKYEKMICNKANINSEEFNILLSIIFENISVMPKAEYKEKLKQAKKLTKDPDDTPFIALYLTYKADGIWTNDKHFKSEKDLVIYRTKELALIFK
jgi:predicted nucleic acid-binding protein